MVCPRGQRRVAPQEAANPAVGIAASGADPLAVSPPSQRQHHHRAGLGASGKQTAPPAALREAVAINYLLCWPAASSVVALSLTTTPGPSRAKLCFSLLAIHKCCLEHLQEAVTRLPNSSWWQSHCCYCCCCCKAAGGLLGMPHSLVWMLPGGKGDGRAK